MKFFSDYVIMIIIVVLVCMVLSGVHAVDIRDRDIKDICQSIPLNVQVQGSSFLVNGSPFQIRSVGYAPTPPGATTQHDVPYGDYYLKEYSGFWERDLPLIREMGANSVRLWTWYSVKPHKQFLDALVEDEERPLRVLLPFLISPDLYEDLSNSQTVREILIDFDNFLERYSKHPAVLGYLIGNELDAVYADQMPAVFALLNSMTNLARAKGVTQPLTSPLSAANFVNIVNKFYTASDLDFWSIQVYEVETLETIIAEYDKVAKGEKPLVVTEFGGSALQQPETRGPPPIYDEGAQADVTVALWDTINGADTIVAGGSIMEWTDEWWKSNIVDYYHPKCPNANPDVQAYCGVQLPTVFLHESWLGITSQTKPDKGLVSTKYCITTRAAYEAMRLAWTGDSGDAGRTLCAHLSQKDPIFYILVPVAVVVIIYLIAFLISCRRRAKKRLRGLKRTFSIAEGAGGGQYALNHRPLINAQNVLEMLVEASFIMYTSPKGCTRMRNFFALLKTKPTIDVEFLNDIVEEYNSDTSATMASLGGDTMMDDEEIDPETWGTVRTSAYFRHEARVPYTFHSAQERVTHLILDRIMASREAVGGANVKVGTAAGAQEDDDDEETAIQVDGLPATANNANIYASGLSALRRASSAYGFGFVNRLMKGKQRSSSRRLNREPSMMKTPMDLHTFEVNLIAQNTRLVYHRYLEGYHMWRSSRNPLFHRDNKIPGRDKFGDDNSGAHWADMLCDLALWNIVSQCSGTIAHSPEKVCEVYHYSLRWMADPALHPEYHAPWKRSFTLTVGNVVEDMPVNGADIEETFESENPATDIWMRIELPATTAPAGSPPIVPKLHVTYHLSPSSSSSSSTASSSDPLDAGMVNSPTGSDTSSNNSSDPALMREMSPMSNSNVVKFEENLSYEILDGALYIYRKALGLGVQYTGEGILVQSLLQIFRQYYHDVSTHEVNYDDVNEDAIGSSWLTKLRRSINARDSPRGGSVDKHWTSMSAAFFKNRRVVRDKEGNGGGESGKKKGHEGKAPLVTPLTFPQRGGILSLLVNYGWLLRINLWLIFIVWYFLQSDQDVTCVDAALPYLALADSGLMVMVNALEYSVTKRVSLFNLLFLGYYALWFLVVLAAAGFISFIPRFGVFYTFTFGDFFLAFSVVVIYILAAIIIGIVKEIMVSMRKSPFPVPGRQRSGRIERQIWGAFWIGVILALAIGVAAWLILTQMTSSSSSVNKILFYEFDFIESVFGLHITVLAVGTFILAIVLGTVFGAFWGRLRLGFTKLGETERERRNANFSAELRYMLMMVAFWFLTLAMYWIILYQLLIPSVVGLTISTTCSCQDDIDLANVNELPACSLRIRAICSLGVILTWVSVLMISFVAMYMCYTIVFLGYGLSLAAANRVGSVKRWRDISTFFHRIQSKCFPVMSKSLQYTKNQELLWNEFLESLFKEHLLTIEERDRLMFRRTGSGGEGGSAKKIPDFTRPVKSHEAQRRIVQFCWSCEGMLKQQKRAPIPEYKSWFQVRTMPSWTVIVPCYAETTFYSQADLIRPSDRPRISAIEYLVANYPDEWDNFAHGLAIKMAGTAASRVPNATRSGADLLRRFLNTPQQQSTSSSSSSSSSSNNNNNSINNKIGATPQIRMNANHSSRPGSVAGTPALHSVMSTTNTPLFHNAKGVLDSSTTPHVKPRHLDTITPGLNLDDVEFNVDVCSQVEINEVCYWASMRGQTLVRTLKGLMNYRAGLERLARAEEGVLYVKDPIERIRRCNDIRDMIRRKFQIIVAYQIYNPDRFDKMWTTERQNAFERMLDYIWGIDVVYNNPNNRQSCMLRFDKPDIDIGDALEWDDESSGDVVIAGQWVINRPGQLVMGEPKAENQAHALMFALNEVIQVNDMNMYNTLEDSFKIPFLMNSFFASPDDWREPSSVIPPFRIVGFPEHTYTRPLSMVGELMGAAEFCFVTITQRVLSALRVRMHYGHPDFIDGYWARTRGGVSKASHLVNTNEDIFTGYEMLGRDERGTYVDWLSQEKGRETSFLEAFTFEAKLAQGAAQQIRSRHLFFLNQRLPVLVKLSLFFGSLGFYLMTLLTTFSIKLYVYAVLMFVSANVSYHRLGLLGSVIAVPWMFQVGFVQALPLLLEYMIRYGLVSGFVAFLAQLPLGLVFFVFHLKTKAHFFAQGLFSAQGGYKGTGRGFGLDRRTMVEMYRAYFHSHFQDALILIAAIIMYAVISPEKGAAILLRMLSIILVIFSWLMAPILFNPFPTRDAMHEDLRQMRDWLETGFRKGIDFKTANSKGRKEAERKAALNTWWTKQEDVSWQAWFIRSVYVETWETADRWFSTPLNSIIWYTQQILFWAWRYFPFLILVQAYWQLESIYYAIAIIVIGFLVLTLPATMSNMHEHFTFLKLVPALVIPSTLVYYHYSMVPLDTIFLSMIIYVLAFFALIEVSLGIWNVLVKLFTFRDFKKMRFVSGTKDRKYLKKRLSVPPGFFQPQILWPYLMMGVLTLGNFASVAFCGALTTLIYNGRVADVWNRAYLNHRL